MLLCTCNQKRLTRIVRKGGGPQEGALGGGGQEKHSSAYKPSIITGLSDISLAEMVAVWFESGLSLDKSLLYQQACGLVEDGDYRH